MSFEKFGIEEAILRGVTRVGYTRPTPVQAAAIPKVMGGGDLVAIARTGTGKTAAFVLPILHRLALARAAKEYYGTRVLILAPTRELALQIMENIRDYGHYLTFRVAAVFGGVDEQDQLKALRKGTQIIVATPGRLIDFLERNKIDFSGLDTLVLDEADRMLHMGFLPDIEKIIAALPRRRQSLMFSATFSKPIESLAKRFQYQPERVQLGTRADPADTVKQSVYEIPPHLKGALLLQLLQDEKFQKVLVFVRMKDSANKLAEFLKKSRIDVTRLHSSRSQEQRLKALHDFKEGDTRVLVATDIVARGIDIDGITHVVNYDFPVNPEDYVHRIGRTGRAEALGDAISFVPRGDLNLLAILEHLIGDRIPRKRLHGFDYHAKSQALEVQPLKKDWRKRTREADAKKAPLARKKPFPKPKKKN